MAASAILGFADTWRRKDRGKGMDYSLEPCWPATGSR